MTICIDLTSISYHLSGIERYTLCITEQMLFQDKRNFYILVCRNELPKEIIKFVDNSRVKVVILRGNHKLFFNQITLAKAINKIKADIYLFLAFTNPILIKHKNLFNTIHDMGVWDYKSAFTFKQLLYFRITMKLSAIRSRLIITPSEFSKKRIHSILNIPKEKIEVIPAAVSKNLKHDGTISDTELHRQFALPSKYILSLSTLEPRKNLKLLIDAFIKIVDRVDYDLVLVGRIGWKVKKLIRDTSIQNRIHLLGFVEDKYLPVLYKNALCFVFTSSYEGFGSPPLEALHFGSPVISSDAASMPEVLQDRATYFKSGNISELQHLLKNINRDKMKIGLSEKQINIFDFEKSAQKLLESLRKNYENKFKLCEGKK